MLALRGSKLAASGGGIRTRCFRPASSVFVPLVHDTREINYRGSKKFQELRSLSPIVAEEAATTRSPQRLKFLEAIHLHKYNKSYDRLFESLGDLAEEVIARPVSEASAFELTVVKSFEHHCGNPRYGYSTRAHGQRSDLLARVGEYLAGSVTSGQAVTVTQGDDARVRREGPTWWQTLQVNGVWTRPAHSPC